MVQIIRSIGFQDMITNEKKLLQDKLLAIYAIFQKFMTSQCPNRTKVFSQMLVIEFLGINIRESRLQSYLWFAGGYCSWNC